ncbi:MAG: hypothetical protein JSU07_04970 [Bacteroidetes bacterium]|nr:hypothetical protein [Bacteroidota bacterium]
MASQSEKGHAKNLANIKLLKEICVQVSSAYSPMNSQLTIASLTTLISQSQTDFMSWKSAVAVFKDLSDKREIAFEPIDKLVTRVNASVQQLNEPQQTFNDIQAIVSKIHGSTAKIKASIEAKKASSNDTTPVEDPNAEPIDPISTSQQSYDSIQSNFDSLIKRLQQIPAYAPNEVDLQIASLITTYGILNSTNTAAGSAEIALSKARNQRNLTFYAPQTGLYDISIKIKKYLKSNSATQNSAYKDATKLSFVKYVQKKKKKKAN